MKEKLCGRVMLRRTKLIYKKNRLLRVFIIVCLDNQASFHALSGPANIEKVCVDRRLMKCKAWSTMEGKWRRRPHHGKLSHVYSAPDLVCVFQYELWLRFPSFSWLMFPLLLLFTIVWIMQRSLHCNKVNNDKLSSHNTRNLAWL